MAPTPLDKQLFEVPPTAKLEDDAPRAPVEKTYLRYDQDQQYLLPPSIADWVEPLKVWSPAGLGLAGRISAVVWCPV